jgi:hypothetical protein
MADQKTAEPRISSFVNPTEEDIATFESLSADQRLALLRRELDKGVASGVSKRTVDEIVAAARAKARARNG